MKILITDLETTCCDKGSITRDSSEIIEFGSVIVELNDTGEVTTLDSFQAFVKPVIKPLLTDFCSGLTSILQEDVDNAQTFESVYSDFQDWFSKYDDLHFASWGDFDSKKLEKVCKAHSLVFPFDIEECFNLMEIYSVKKFGCEKKGLLISNELIANGFEFDGFEHRAIDDAKNASLLIKYCFPN